LVSTGHKSAVVALATAAVAMLVLGACSPRRSAAVQNGTSSATGQPSPTIEPAAVTVSPARDAADVNPLSPIKVAVSGGTLSAVRVANVDGKSVKGAMSADKRSWLSSEPLGYDKSYLVTTVARNLDRTETRSTSSFRTVKPANLTMPYIQTAAGGAIEAGTTFGVGQVIRIHFDESIPNRKAAQATLAVKTFPAQVGGFKWLSDQDVYWRTQNYLRPGTKLSITAKVYGREFGGGLYGQADATTWFKVGAKHVSVADDNDKLVRVYENDKLVRTMPTSMGRDARIAGDNGTSIDLRTNSGPHVVVGGETNINMNSASFGLSKGANAYKTIVPVGVRISYDGEYVHWADWSIWAQGNTDTSHGCLNVSPDNAWWFYNFSVPGDIVDVRNTGRPLELWNSGYWTASWAQWTAGSIT